MTRELFVRARNPGALPPLIEELQALGVSRERIRVYGNEAPPDLAVEVIPWRSRSRAVLEGASVGAVLALLLGLALGGWVLPDVFALFVLGAAIGGLSRLLWIRARTGALSAQRLALSAGELVLSIEVEGERLGEVEDSLSNRHPELMILGSDPAGTPPFP